MSTKLCLLLLTFLLLITPASADDERILTPVEPDRPVPEYVTLLLQVATEELGYTEGKGNYTKYGEWVGEPSAQWCAEFLCWSVDQVDQRFGTALLRNVYPFYSGQNSGRDWYIAQGRYVTRTGFLDGWGYQWYPGREGNLRNGVYIPQPGDWVFFTWTNDSDTDHVAMVEYVSVDQNGVYYVHVIEGNNPSSVSRNIYRLKDDKILGYGTVHDSVGWTMRSGNTGAKVSALQQKLVDLGYLDPQYATGRFGPSTVTAVRTFQKEHGLKTTGRATREMQELLDAAYADFINWQVIDEASETDSGEVS